MISCELLIVAGLLSVLFCKIYLQPLIPLIILFFCSNCHVVSVLRGKEHSWFKSHLSNEKQFLMVRDEKSTSGDLFCVVPQGSLLKPICIFTVKISTDLACPQRRYPCNTSGFRRQCFSSPQGTHLPIYANLLWFSVSFAKLRRSGPVWNFLLWTLSLSSPWPQHFNMAIHAEPNAEALANRIQVQRPGQGQPLVQDQ